MDTANHRVEMLLSPAVNCWVSDDPVLSAVNSNCPVVLSGLTVVIHVPAVTVSRKIAVLLTVALITNSAGDEDAVSDGPRGVVLVPLELPVDPAAKGPPEYSTAQSALSPAPPEEFRLTRNVLAAPPDEMFSL